MGPSVNKGEPDMDTNDWRTRLIPGSRQKIVNKIMDTLMKHIPYSGPEEIEEIERLAATFEERVFSSSVLKIDYLREISIKILTMEAKAQNAAGSSSSISADNNIISLDEKALILMGHSVNNGEPTMDTNDWRAQLPPGSRQKVVNKIMDTLMKHIPYSGPEEIEEIERLAATFEERVFSSSVLKIDYLREISIKMLTMEAKTQNAAGSSSSIPADNNILSLDEQDLILMGTSVNNGEPTMDTNDWRAQLPPGSRQKIVNKIMDTLMKHLPYSGPEGIEELKRISATFEDKVFSSAVDQTDYVRKISIKMLTMETKTRSSSSSIPGDSNSLSLDELDKHMNNGNVEPSLVKEEPAINSGDWRTQLPPVTRHKIIDMLMESLKKHVPYSGQEGIEELRRIAISFEELIFNTAINQVDYFRKIPIKMQTMEVYATKSVNFQAIPYMY